MNRLLILTLLIIVSCAPFDPVEKEYWTEMDDRLVDTLKEGWEEGKDTDIYKNFKTKQECAKMEKEGIELPEKCSND
jgi:hypothetical protein